ncbi:DUF1254 domain-containing protein [Nitratireductor sp. GISD-1A_MAKvit]|uniref:DUF1254 domain-containing protein n=1 Tax=Nitratireductor sp. GISD-1A_MAKvit TaxID=3234198 RepID=UPI003466208C
MIKPLRLLFLGLFGAAAVHIAIVFLLPAYSERDAWSELASKGGLYTTVRLGQGSAEGVLGEKDNPFFERAACRFDLADGMARVTSSETVPFWSFSIYDREGFNVFNVSDRSASDGKLDALIVTPAQLLELRKGMPEALQTSLIAETELEEGMIVVRSFLPDESWRGIVDRFFARMRCEAY